MVKYWSFCSYHTHRYYIYMRRMVIYCIWIKSRNDKDFVVFEKNGKG